MADSPSPEPDGLRSGGRVLADQLRIHGVERCFTVPGESFLALLDALYDTPEIALISCRQEGAAAMMADAYGKLTGAPGVCCVTRGPGATNASAGVHIAFQDSTPMIVLIGQVERGVAEREAFQEIDYRRMFGQMAKWVAQVDDAARIPELLSRAFYTATAGRPGPVVLALPQDVLRELVQVDDAKRYQRVEAHPGGDDMTRLQRLLAEAERPLLILGGGGWSPQACERIRSFAEAHDLPVAAAFRCQDYFDNRFSNYAGDFGLAVNPRLVARLKTCDLLLVVGARLGEITTGGYTLLDIPRPTQTLVHVYPGAEELGRVYQPDVGINASVGAFAAATDQLEATGSTARTRWLADAHAEYLEHIAPPPAGAPPAYAEILAWLSERLPEDAIVSNGAGVYTTWLHRFFQYKRYRTQLAPTAGSMGYGTPAAIAAKHLYPERIVVGFAGDGCFLMTGQELATAVQHRLNIIVVVVNNNMYGTIRLHQERDYPGRVIGTALVNPDFTAYARAFGAHGEVVERTEDFAPAFERALDADRPALIELRVDAGQITPEATLDDIRARALASRRGPAP